MQVVLISRRSDFHWDLDRFAHEGLKESCEASGVAKGR